MGSPLPTPAGGGGRSITAKSRVSFYLLPSSTESYQSAGLKAEPEAKPASSPSS